MAALLSFVPMAFPGAAGEAPHRGEQNLEALSLVLELTSDQVKQTHEVIRASETAKEELRSKIRVKFARLNETVRSETPRDSDIRALCREIGDLQEQLIYRDAQTTVAFRKILDSNQLEKLNRLEQLDSGVSGLGLGKNRRAWHKERGKDD